MKERNTWIAAAGLTLGSMFLVSANEQNPQPEPTPVKQTIAVIEIKDQLETETSCPIMSTLNPDGVEPIVIKPTKLAVPKTETLDILIK